MRNARWRKAALLLILLLSLSLLPAHAEPSAGASRLFGTALIDREEQILSAAVLGDTVYVRSSFAFYRYAPGDARAQRVCDMMPSRPDLIGFQEGKYDAIFAWEGRLYGLNVNRGLLYALAVHADSVEAALYLELDMKPLLLGEGATPTSFHAASTPLEAGSISRPRRSAAAKTPATASI